MLWNRFRPWIGVGFLLFEAIQPLFHHSVEPLIVGAATSMMVVEVVARAVKGAGKTSEEE